MVNKEGKKKNKKKYSLFNRILLILFASPVVLVVVLFIFISYGFLGYMPSFEELENPKSNLATEIYSADQALLGTYFKENRTNISYEELSPYLINALIATEDKRFYDHSGIDAEGLARAIVFLGKKGGGSTITQQLAKLFFHEPAQNNWERVLQKLNEWVIAVKLEKRYTKEEIIAMYFNKFDFLNLAVGIKSASKVYFNTSPDSLKIEQAAMLVGMAKNPALYNPLPNRNPEGTKNRRNVVLLLMKERNHISLQEYDSLKILPLELNYQKVDHKEGIATYFREYIRMTMTAKEPDSSKYINKAKYWEDLDEWNNNPLYGWCNKNKKANGKSYNIYSDGLRIFTTINSKMQKYGEDAVCEHLGIGSEIYPNEVPLQKTFFLEHKVRWERDKAPFYNMTYKKIEKLMDVSMRRSERYRVLKNNKVPEDSIKAIFNIPIQMNVFSWSGEIDTVLSPMDSMRYYKHYLRAGLMSMEPQTGYVRAYVGGINYKHFQFDHVTQGRRQVGSTFKPFVYTLAMQNGYSPCYRVPNIPTSFEMPEGQPPWTPKNSSDKKLEGKMISLKMGLAKSINYISAWVIKQFNPQAVIKIARDMGIKSDIPAVPSICLGVADIKLYEMVGAFSTFANRGIYTQAIFVTRIEDKNGNVISSFIPERTEAISEETAYLMLYLLKGVTQGGGTGVRLRFRYGFTNDIGAKTGTTQNQSDGWFMGLTPHLVTGIWTGCEDRAAHFRGIHYGQAASMALPVWAYYMQKVYADSTMVYKTSDKFEKPSKKIVVETDCKKYDEEHSNTNDINFLGDPNY
jgi:penicillin-binding protein 1A